MLTAQQVKEHAKKAGADVIGIASTDRFADVPAEQSPLSIFPHAQSVIVLGRRITRGSLRGYEEGTHFNSYELFGSSLLDHDFNSMLTFEVVSLLEDNGWEAQPLFPYPTEAYPQGAPVAPDRPAPNVYPDMEYAAVAAGLGEIAAPNVLLTPRFGPRQRLQMIITDAPLEADPLVEEPICGKCGLCAESCPLGAIDTSVEEEICIAGKRMTVWKVDYAKCRTCRNGAYPNRYHASGKPDRLGAICMRTCVHKLEQAGKVSNTFNTPLRTREAWYIDQMGQTHTLPAEPEGRGCNDPGGFRQAEEGK